MQQCVKRKLLMLALCLAAAGAVLLCVAHAHRAVPVYVVQRTDASAAEASAVQPDTAEKLNINEATKEELTELPGIGDVLADRILAYRETHGGFYDVGELREVEGIGEQLLQNLLSYICT